MGKTTIEWTDYTFNPWLGCTKVSPGCDHCYAEARMDKRLHRVTWGAGQPRQRTKTWGDPVRWNKGHEAFYAAHGRRQRVFCASLADVFDNEVPQAWRADLFDLIRRCENLDFLLLTKRIGNAARGLPSDWGGGWPNVWLGTTIVNQEEADRDIPKLLAVPARVRFLSMEPLLGPVDLRPWIGAGWAGPGGAWCQGVQWVIAGGESGPGARPMHPGWPRSLRDQCAAAGVPFLFKQHGEWLATAFCDDDMAMLPSRRTVYVRRDGSYHDGGAGVDLFGGDEETAWVGKKAAGRLLDGIEHSAFPEASHG